MSPISVNGLMCKPKQHERAAYITLKRSEKDDSTLRYQYSVLILSDMIMK